MLDNVVDPLYNEINGNLDDDNVKASANIAQSKIAGLLASLASKLTNIGDTITGALLLKFVNPFVRFIGTEANAGDWRLIEDAGHMYFQANLGTELEPFWVTQYLIERGGGGGIGFGGIGQGAALTQTFSLAPKFYVDDAVFNQTRRLNFNQLVKVGGHFSTGSLSFVAVSFLGTSFSTGGVGLLPRRIKVSFTGSVENDTVDCGVVIAVLVDGTILCGVDGTSKFIAAAPSHSVPLSLTVVSPLLVAGTHEVAIHMRAVNGGIATLLADSGTAAVMVIEELPYAI